MLRKLRGRGAFLFWNILFLHSKRPISKIIFENGFFILDFLQKAYYNKNTTGKTTYQYFWPNLYSHRAKSFKLEDHYDFKNSLR